MPKKSNDGYRSNPGRATALILSLTDYRSRLFFLLFLLFSFESHGLTAAHLTFHPGNVQYVKTAYCYCTASKKKKTEAKNVKSVQSVLK